MALILASPVVVPFVLRELDPTGETVVTFRQAMSEANQIRDRLVFGAQAKTFTDQGLRLDSGVPFSVRQMIECRLTIAGLDGVYRDAAKEVPLMRFKNGKLAMTDDEFNKAWGDIPPGWANTLHNCCLDANPDWDFRTDPNSARESDEE